MKVTLSSRLTLKTIDLLAVTTCPAFIVPDGVFTINAIGRIEIGTTHITNIYTKNDEHFYLIQVYEENSAINSVCVLQNVCYINPQTQEDWDSNYTEVSQETILLDDIAYKVNGGKAGVLTKCKETVVDATGTRTVTSEFQTFSRDTSDNPVLNKRELLLAAFEVDEIKQAAGIAYYVGYQLHQNCLTIAG